MIKRIVKLTFQPEHIENFLHIFDANSAHIRQFPGCHHLELWRCPQPRENVFFTYSLWESQESLDQYRHSELFQTTWDQTSRLFAGKAEAWSFSVERTL